MIKFFDAPTYFTHIYPHYTYQNLLKTAKFEAKEVFEGSSFYSSAYDCFLCLHHIDGGLSTDLYSHFKVHINLADNRELIDVWNTIVTIITSEPNVVRQIKVVVPEWVELLYAHDEIKKEIRDRRLAGAQITLYVYFKPGDKRDRFRGL